MPVEAHLNSTGMGLVYDGFRRISAQPGDILAVLALALFAGQRGTAYGRRALFVLPGAWLAGGLFGLTIAATGGAALTFLSFLLLGGLLAADAALSPTPITALASLIGLFTDT